MGNSNFTYHSNKVLLFNKSYNADYVIDTFNKLRNIMLNLNTQTRFLNYIVNTKQSTYVHQHFLKQTLSTHFYSRKASFPVKFSEGKYIQLLTCTTLQFILGTHD